MKSIQQRTKSNMENKNKELQKMKQKKGTSNHEFETLRKPNKIQIQAVPDKEKESRRLTAIIEKEKGREKETNKILHLKLQAGILVTDNTTM